MKLTLVGEYEIQSAHHLNGMRPNHKCARIHGHNYTIRVHVSCAPHDMVNGMVIDAENLDIAVKPVFARLDHQYLNKLEPAANYSPMVEQPTAENLAIYLFSALKFLSNNGRTTLDMVEVYEHGKLAARATP